MERRMINRLLGSVVVGLLLLTSSGCYYDNVQELYPGSGNCDTTAVTYNLTVKPIIQFSCLACHGAAQAPTSGNNINLEGYTSLSGYISTNHQKFVDAIQHTGTASPMPKNLGQLSSCDIKKIVSWINAGLPNN